MPDDDSFSQTERLTPPGDDAPVGGPPDWEARSARVILAPPRPAGAFVMDLDEPDAFQGDAGLAPERSIDAAEQERMRRGFRDMS